MAPKKNIVRRNTRAQNRLLKDVEKLWQDVKTNRDAMHGTMVVMRDALDLRTKLSSPPERVAAVGISWDHVLQTLHIELAMESSAYTNSFEKADSAFEGADNDEGEGVEGESAPQAPNGMPIPAASA